MNIEIGKLIELFDLTGKTALITGASSGLGERFARVLASAGARVILLARDLDKLQSLSTELKNSRAYQMDISDKNSVHQVFSELESHKEKIYICINNAGLFKPTPVFDPDDDAHFESILQTNVAGTWYVTKAAANHMRQHNIAGSIINIGSINGANYLNPNRAAYCASKAAVIHLTKALVGELSPHSIRINCIVPGLFHTPATDYKINSDEARHEMENNIPLHFIASPRDIDATILYLASNKASGYVTGSCLTIDGGISWGG